MKKIVISMLACLMAVIGAATLLAGGPENLVLVVNANSASSKMIANHYIALRGIPSQNVIYLNGIPDSETVSLELFRETILKPVFAQIEKRRIANNIDYIVYSADFPTAINIAPHLKMLSQRLAKLPKEQRFDRRLFNPVASINSLTFFAGAVMTDEPAYMMLDSNNYYRKPASVLLRQPFSGGLQNEYEKIVRDFDLEADEFFRESAKTLEKIARRNPRQTAVAYSIAQCYGKLGNGKKAAAWLARSVQLGWMFRKQTKADQMFDNVRNDEAFTKIANAIPDMAFDFVPTLGFKSRYAFAPNGMINSMPGQGNRHFLSTVLAVTRNEGINERESLEYLQRSVRADGTRPQGKYYFVETADIRTTTRKPNFEVAIQALEQLGYESEIIRTKIPVKQKDILGLTSGTPAFTWTKSGSRFVPGAIADNLTSFGGQMKSSSQTKLTEFLKYGAAGASGTVTEPYAVQPKFPHPMIHVHYARGCSLAEAFYQSVQGPSQLLIVGDALCRPFAMLPQVEVTGLTAHKKIKGSQIINFDASKSPVAVRGMQLLVDGRLVHAQSNLEMFVFDTSGLSDGYHELRFVAVANNLIETTNSVVIPIDVNNQGRQVTLSSRHKDFLETDKVKLSASSNFGEQIGLVHNGRMIAQESGQNVEFEIDASLLGRGPVRVEAVAVGRDDGETSVENDTPGKAKAAISSRPLNLLIEGRLSTKRRKTNSRKNK